MSVQSIFANLSNVPVVAIILFVILGAVLVAELWYLRPKRKLPAIPPPEETSPQPFPKKTELKFPSQKQTLAIGLLLLLLVVIPLAVFLFKQTQEAKKVSLAPSPAPFLVKTPELTKKPSPLPTSTFTPLPTETATPSATPKELAGRVPSTPTPTATATAKPKVGTVSPSPSPTGFPKAEKPKELPDASSIRGTILGLVGGALLILAGLIL